MTEDDLLQQIKKEILQELKDWAKIEIIEMIENKAAEAETSKDRSTRSKTSNIPKTKH
jgi:hypothetical protein